MDENLIYRIGISLVYESSEWHKIILEGITPFLQDEKIQHFSLKLNTTMGDHIRLTLGTNEKKYIGLAKKTDSFFKDFLLKNPSYRTHEIPEGLKLFLDFENNTIHYGAFPYFNPIIANDPYLLLSQGTSLTLIQAFQYYQNSTLDNRFEIILELLITFCKSINFNRIEASSFFDTLVNHEYAKYKLEAQERIKKNCLENFENNKAEIYKHLDENWNVDYNKTESWKSTWMATVKSFSENINSYNTDDKNHLFYMVNNLIDVFNFNKNSIIIYFLLSNSLK